MNQACTNDDLYFQALIVYTYGWSALLKVEITEGRANFTTDAPEEDVKLLLQEYNGGESAISSVKDYAVVIKRMLGLVRVTKQRGQTTWVSESWVNGRGK
jgi:hypothetical protein